MVSGKYDKIGVDSDSSVTVTSGGINTINLSSDASVTCNDSGNDTINTGSNDTVVIGSACTSYGGDTVNGSGDTITTNGSDTLTASSDSIVGVVNGDVITGQGDTIAAISESMTISNKTTNADTVVGNNDTIAATSSLIAVNGTNDFLSGNYNTINMVGPNELLSVNGVSDAINASGDVITVLGNNSGIHVQGNENSLNITASNESIEVTGNGNSFGTLGGANDTIIENLSNGTSIDDYTNSSGVDHTTVYADADGEGAIIGGYGFTGPGAGADSDNGYGNYGFAGSQAIISSAVNKNIGSIAQYDLNNGDTIAATAAETALQQAHAIATSTPTTGTGSAVLEGAKWDQQVITWSLADSSGTNSAPFSSYMGSSYESTVKDAFNAWAAADPGIKFEEVSDSSQSDIRIGFGNFDTANSGVVGYTSYNANNGQMDPDAIIRLEDPTDDPLANDPAGQQTYAGTEATFDQVLQHEIGHALGLADNADMNSIMYYELTSSNRSLDSTDLSGINSLYATGSNVSPSGSSSVNQLIQAMATFNSGTGAADTSLVPATLLANTISLAPSVHAN